MIKLRLIFTTIICLIFVNCEIKNDFPTDKRFWEANDYKEIIKTLKYSYKPDERLPSFNDPETRIVIEKLTDHQNFNIILDDDELGISYRDNFADAFFKNLDDMNQIYRAIDRKDHYLYEIELLRVHQFIIAFHLKSYKTGKIEILEITDDPDSNETKNLLKSNEWKLIENFKNYLNELKFERSFSEKGKALLAKGIDVYFPKLIEQYPNADFSSLELKINLTHKKCKSERIKNSLTKIKKLIEARKLKTVSSLQNQN